MRFLKIIFAAILAILAITFIVENRTVLEQTSQLRLDLYFKSFTTPGIPLWVLILFSFFLGVFTASLYGFYEIFKNRQTIRQLRQNLEILDHELKRTGGGAEAAAAPSKASPAAESSAPPPTE
jgi:uncharacterized integral membrane protein